MEAFQHYKDLAKTSWRRWSDPGKNVDILKRFFKNFSISAGGSASTAFIGIGKTAVLTKSLSIAAYGKVLIVVDLFRFLMMFLDVRVYDVMYRFYPEFVNKGDKSAVRGLLFCSLAICLSIGALVCLTMFFAASWIAANVYDAPELVLPFKVFACAIFFTAFKGFYTPILRIKDRFASIIVPQVVGQGMVLIMLLIYLVGYGGRDIAVVIGAFAVGEVVQAIIPLVISLREVSEFFKAKEKGILEALRPHRSGILSTLFQTNIAGYLKLGAEEGGSFLLGILSTPTQVALYGIARQLAKPLMMLQGNVQTAIMPEIFSLRAESKNWQLFRLCKRFVTTKAILGAVALGLAYWLAEPVILLVSNPEYLEATTVFYVMIGTVYLTFVTLTFYPLTVAMDRMKRRNLCVSVRFVYIGVAILAGFDAFKLAVAQFAGSLTTRLGSDFFVFRELRDDAVKDGDGSVAHMARNGSNRGPDESMGEEKIIRKQ
jgi:O-antigen/teichoic acid export membrane protein